jgi:hypothetical protein
MDWYTIQLTDKKDRMRTAKYSEYYMLIPKYPILSEILHVILEVVFRIFQFSISLVFVE